MHSTKKYCTLKLNSYTKINRMKIPVNLNSFIRIILFTLAYVNVLFTAKSQITSISGGSRFGLAICSNGSVYSWGSNLYGQLGTGQGLNTDKPNPVTFPAAVKITAVDGGSGSCALALDANKNVWAWGLNCDGQLGNGSGGRSKEEIQNQIACAEQQIVYSPVKVLKGAQTPADGADNSAFLAQVKLISGGSTTSYAVVGPKNTLMAWGSNVGIVYGHYGPMNWITAGLLGNNDVTMDYSNIPVYVKKSDGTVLENVIAIDASDVNAVAVLADGSVYSWGLNTNNSLGIGKRWTDQAFSLYAKPVKINVDVELKNIVDIAAGDQHYLALDKEKNVYSWGGAWAGQTGVNFDDNGLYAQRVYAGNSSLITKKTFLVKAVSISASQIGSAVVVQDTAAIGGPQGFLYTFGGCGTYRETAETSNAELGGQLGQNHPADCIDKTPLLTPTLVARFYDGTTEIPSASMNVISVTSGAGVFYVTAKNKKTGERAIYVMGANNMGQLGIGDNAARSVPTKLTTLGCK